MSICDRRRAPHTHSPFTGRTRALPLVPLSLLPILFLSACASSSPPAPTAATAAAAQGATGATVAASSIKLAGIVFQEDQFFRLVLFGMRDAARKAGVELLEGNSANKPDKEIELVNTYAVRKVDAILVSPLSQKASIPALKAASDKGIAVVTYNTPVDADFPVAHIECSASDLGEKTGQAAVDYIKKNLGGQAKVAIVAFKSQVPEQSDARTGGFKKKLQELPGVTIVAEQDAWLAEMAVKRVGDILTAHPEVQIIYAANDGGTVGATMAVKSAAKAGKVAVFGTDASRQVLSLLQAPDGILQAVTAQRPVEIGARAVELALTKLRGAKVEKTTLLPGLLLCRSDPAGVAAYEKQLDAWIGKGQE